MSPPRLRHAVRLRVEKSDDVRPLITLDLIESGTARLTAAPELSYPDGQIKFEPGDVLFSKLRPYLAKSLAVSDPCHGSGELLALVPGDRIEGRFLLYVTLSQPWLDFAELSSYGTKMPRTSWEAMSDFQPDLPPLDVQRRIAGFLDDQVTRIDNTIHVLNQQAARLRKGGRSLITSYMSGEASPPGYEDSGLDGRPRRMSKWETVPLRHVADVIVSNVDKKTVEGEWPVRLVNYTDVYYGDVITPDLALMEATATPEQGQRFSVSAGDILITKDSEAPDDIAVPAFIGRAEPGMVCGYHLAMVRPHSTVHPRFLNWAIHSQATRGQAGILANGITRYGIGLDAMRSLPVPFPPLGVQRQIADYLDEQILSMQTALEIGKRQVERLQDSKRSLITAAVTGQFDVTTADGARVQL